MKFRNLLGWLLGSKQTEKKKKKRNESELQQMTTYLVAKNGKNIPKKKHDAIKYHLHKNVHKKNETTTKKKEINKMNLAIYIYIYIWALTIIPKVN